MDSNHKISNTKNRVIKHPVLLIILLLFSYISEIASTGQTSAHAAQSIQSSALTTNISPAEIASTGHCSYKNHSQYILLR